jgi:transposase InsO family protein
MDQGYHVSEKMVTELMREMGLYSVRAAAKKNYYIQTKLEKKTKPNVLNRRFNASKPNKAWVGDVTCFKLGEKYYFICVIIDLFSRKVIAYRVSRGNSTQLVSATFRQAIEDRKPTGKLIFHSDRGTPYVSNTFRKLLRTHNTVQSLSNSGQPHDNAVSESFFASMKQEELYRGGYSYESALKKGVDKYITFYNTKRPHAAMNYKIPERIEKSYWDSVT